MKKKIENRNKWKVNNPDKLILSRINYKNKYPEKYKARNSSQRLERMMYRNINGILLDTKESHIKLLEELKKQN